MSCYVKIYYGPSEAFYTISHKPQKLKGLRDQLLKLGFRVDFVPVEFRNYCMMEMCGYEVFRCNIRNLMFNTPHALDLVSQRAIAAVEDAKIKLLRAKTYFWLWYLIEDQIFKRSEYAPKDYWPFDLKLKPFASCRECAKCCGIPTADHEDVAN